MAQTSPAFRSKLEQDIADELDAIGIVWEYEQPVILPDGTSPRYLPDFQIVCAHPESGVDCGLDLPAWIEGKPQEFIYDLRDSLGITRRYGDRFQGTVVAEVTADDIRGRHIEELWKPKKLAEATGQVVLVVGGVGGINRLTCEMRPEGVAFQRDNWIANHRGYEQRRERAEREARYEADRRVWQEQHAEREARQAEAEAERQQERARQMKVILSHKPAGFNRFAGSCVGCGGHVPEQRGNLRSVPLVGGGSRWLVTCTSCETTHR